MPKAYECHHDHFTTEIYNYVISEMEKIYMPCDTLRYEKDYCKYYEPTFWKKVKIKIFGV